MHLSTRLGNRLAKSPARTGLAFGAVGVLLSILERSHLAGQFGSQVANDPPRLLLNLALTGMLAFSGWLLGRLAQQARRLENAQQERTALQRSQEHSRALFEYGSAEIVAVDLNGRITSFNNAVRTSGRPLPAIGDRWLASNVPALVTSADGFHGTLDAALADCIATRTTRDFADCAFADARWNVSITPFGRGAIISSVDISEQKKRENIEHALYHILDATTRSQSLHELLASVHEHVSTVMRAKNFFVAMYDPASDRFSFLFCVDEKDKYPLNTPLDLHGGLTDHVRKTGKPVLLHREKVGQMIDRGDVALLGQSAESWLGVPFQSGADLGVLVVQSYTPGDRYTPSDRDALLVITGQVGLAIERKRAEEELGKRKQLLERILDNSAMGFAINNTETGQVLYVNDAFPRTYRIGRSDCTDVNSFFRAVYGKREALGEKILADLASNDPDRMVWENVDFIDEQGEGFSISARNIALPEQQIMISTVLDVTAQKHMRERQALLESRMQLTQKMESVGVLAGGIAHDFNNLLTAILGNLNLAEDEGDLGERNAYLKQASQACIDATHLTRQLLTFARGGEPVRKAAYIRNLILDTVGFALSGSNVKAEFELDVNVSAVEVDEGQLKQVMHNLILNAKQAMPDGGLVKVRAANASRVNASGTEDHLVRVSVRDFGRGISEENLPKVFEPYFTTKQGGSGSGLGLATAFSIIRRHGGTLSVESVLGEGSVFVIELPATTRAVERTDPLASGVIYGGGRKVLVMDDEEAIRRIAERMLGTCGYAAVSVPDGAAALNAYRVALRSDQPFAAVILDLTVPGGMGGREAVQGLQAMDPAVKAIVSSGYSDANESATYRDQGFTASLQKPYTRNDLARTMARVLNLK